MELLQGTAGSARACRFDTGLQPCMTVLAVRCPQVWGHRRRAAERQLWQRGGDDSVHCSAAEGPLYRGSYLSPWVNPVQPASGSG